MRVRDTCPRGQFLVADQDPDPGCLPTERSDMTLHGPVFFLPSCVTVGLTGTLQVTIFLSAVTTWAT